MQNIVNIERAETGVIKNRGKYPECVSAISKALSEFARRSSQYNLDYCCYPSLVLEGLSKNCIKKLNDFLYHIHVNAPLLTARNFSMKHNVIRRTLSHQGRKILLSKIAHQKKCAGLILRNESERLKVLKWLEHHAPCVDVYKDILFAPYHTLPKTLSA